MLKAVSPVPSLPKKSLVSWSPQSSTPSLGYMHVVFEQLLAKGGGSYLVSHESLGSVL